MGLMDLMHITSNAHTKYHGYCTENAKVVPTNITQYRGDAPCKQQSYI